MDAAIADSRHAGGTQGGYRFGATAGMRYRLASMLTAPVAIVIVACSIFVWSSREIASIAPVILTVLRVEGDDVELTSMLSELRQRISNHA
jgi:hypothetical protein